MQPTISVSPCREPGPRSQAAWGVPLDPEPGLTVTEIVTGALEGRFKATDCLGENPFLSIPTSTR